MRKISGRLVQSLLLTFTVAISVGASAAEQTLLQEGPNPNRSSTSLAAPPLEIVSVKQSRGDQAGSTMGVTNDGLIVTNVPLLIIIQTAFAGHFTNGNITGLPSWEMTSYDIQGKVSESNIGKLQNLTQQQRIETLRVMLQAVLIDRFHMVYQDIDKEGPVYRLVVAKGGSKLNEPSSAKKGTHLDQRGTINASLTMNQLAQILSGPITGRPVIDDTGLQGKYDVTLTWTPDMTNSEGQTHDPGPPLSASGSAPSIFTAVEQQLGLRLASGKGPTKGIAISKIERPSAN
jgi:uncharacterized protein (TIGR03435 family)